MEIEIPTQIYEELREKSEETGFAVEKIVEFAFRKYLERGEENAD